MDKLCIDCKHYVHKPEVKELGFYFEHQCSVNVKDVKSLVTGEMVKEGEFTRCELLRTYCYRCGPEAKLWKEKQINRINLDVRN